MPYHHQHGPERCHRHWRPCQAQRGQVHAPETEEMQVRGIGRHGNKRRADRDAERVFSVGQRALPATAGGECLVRLEAQHRSRLSRHCADERQACVQTCMLLRAAPYAPAGRKMAALQAQATQRRLTGDALVMHLSQNGSSGAKYVLQEKLVRTRVAECSALELARASDWSHLLAVL